MTLEQKLRKPQILVVEDNPGDIELLQRALETADVDCELSIIDDGEEALARVQRRGKYADSSPPDLAILDLNLPKVNGQQLLAAMRQSAEFDAVPIVVLTSSSSLRERAQLDALRITRHIAKPADLDEYMKIGIELKQILGDTLSLKPALIE
ncbi:MAG: response regulator [Bryobacteraceae bacterium]